ncbi:DNA repair protein RadA [Candidatus Uhrbacteria bacterium CG_4_9_14_3_um_filter_41_35]|uniref:DNA repair protein RadA n=1 Tax=Candidatus Uhrbacteria bacterium CG_4_9_14_3_um_filter_41_35 TaxID=1975034 RepID=A0A2M7XDJ9_9BACT|nr:MAG: DNA repair protein RadA [Candidatus Uhrbacteria bacterium CG11_big_fil_rev_8_21_14_0_20_41_9]PJA45960.1 MAG: DNA repair protein RadA [Candidatus Uhrbacteria bacterium CG_4_9_14_3_um_filter_41_35]
MFNCSHCDAQYLKWQGRCNECSKWGSLIEDVTQPKTTSPQAKTTNQTAVPLLNLSDARTVQVTHRPTNISELDRVLSGGIVPGSVTLLAGEPGIGKSTLVAQIASSFTQKNQNGEISKVYYVSGEESEGQVSMRLARLGIDSHNIVFSNTVDVGGVITTAVKEKPALLIIDSIQTMMPCAIDNLPGSPTAVRSATAELIGFAKSSNIPVLLIGQVTKDGNIAGPKTLEHLVDTLLTLEGEKDSTYRVLRASKNRFGATDEVGVFEMKESGMVPVVNPSAKFLEERAETAGSVITCIMEGTRPFLIEVQALAEKSYFPNPIRRTSGFDSARLQMLLAIISKRAGVNVSTFDIYINIVGGLKVHETAVDLAVCTAIIASVKEKIMAKDTLVVGELGLGGEIRSVSFLEKRLKEAERLGITKAITPKTLKNIKDLI